MNAAQDADAAARHLRAAAAAVLIFVVGMTAVSLYSDRLVARHIDVLSGSRYAQKNMGLVLQREALRRDDLLPFYGSSDVDDARISPYHARDVFAKAPTGFRVFTVGAPGLQLLLTAENIAALGPALRGRKVAISLTPAMFYRGRTPESEDGYIGNFSPLQALTLLLRPDSNPDLKEDFARQMLTYPSTLDRDQILRLTAVLTARGGGLAYRVLLPLAHLQRISLGLQDSLVVAAHILANREAGPQASSPSSPPDWNHLKQEATARFRSVATRSPFGIADVWWKNNGWQITPQRDSFTDRTFDDQLARSETWDDFDLLLRSLQETGAQPLLLAMPFHDGFMTFTGVSPGARRQYYARVQALASKYHARAVIFDDHETDPDFFYDLWGHLSHRGWIFYDEALDAFYHGDLR